MTRCRSSVSVAARELIAQARERQRVRLRGDAAELNAHMDARALRRHVPLDGNAEELLQQAAARGLLSTRGQHRVIRVARTIADLAARDRVGAGDVGAAIALRPEALLAPR